MNAVTLRLSMATTALLGAGLAVLPEARADDDPPSAATPSSGDAQAAVKAKNLDAVVVTGSHLRGVDLANEHPIQTITHEQILHTGLTAVADIVQSLIVADGPTLNRNINNGGNGQLEVNLRSLGANRTLVLVNGQRWVSAIDGAIDLSAIPLSLVDHIDVLKDGASAVYGSDAIGGVINIVTRSHFNGAQLGLYAGVNAHGDGARRNVEFSFGRDDGTTRWAVGLEAGKDDPIMASARTISAVPAIGLPLDATGSPYSGYGVFTVAGLGRVVLIPGQPGTSPDDFRPFQDCCDRNFNYQTYNYLQTPQERRAGFAQFRRELSPTLGFSADLILDRRQSAQQLAPPNVNFSSRQFTGEQSYDVSPDSLYNPFGAPVAVHLRILAGGVRRLQQDVDTTRLRVGLDGSFTWAGRDWNWNADAISTRAAQTETAGPYADNEKLRLAVGPSFRDASGTPHCGTPAQVIAGCVPLDLFGGPQAITPAMLDYVGVDVSNHTTARSDLLALHLSSELWHLPGGAVGFAAGIEHRSEHGRVDPDPLVSSGRANGTGITYAPTHGAYAVNEAYAELDLPLLANRPFARRLDLNLATRLSDYSRFGTTDNSRMALKWRPFADLLVRASWAQGFRAPSVLEAFGGPVQYSFGNAFDPCAVYSDYGYVPPPDVAARCAARGVPPGVQAPLEVDSTIGSNPQLRPETSRSLTAGLLYSPRWAPGLDVSVDWYRIKLRNAINDNPQIQNVLDACYTRGDPVACSRITRRADGTLQHVTAIDENLTGGLQTDGFDVALAWKRSTRWGDFNLRWDTAYVTYWGEIGKPARGATLADGSLAEGNATGTINQIYGTVWRLRSVATLAWQRGAWGATVTGRYFGPLGEYCDTVTNTVIRTGDASLLRLCSDPNHMEDGGPWPRNRVGAVTYVDLEGRWKAPWNGTFTLGVRNAFDRDPPHAWSYSASTSFVPDYDVPGRFWYVSYRQSF
ncbi:MAG: TonB-dependent receptor [Proteobacteria bacterium]|nr:TonB-dependent receptor [Pseudomonadota bacterium]